MTTIKHAIGFAATCHSHANQPSYYEDHLKHVQAFVTAQTSDKEVIIASILHDIIEDTRIGFDSIEKIYGPRVAFLVDCVTDETGYPDRKTTKQMSYWKIRRDPAAVMIKLCDRMHNVMRSKSPDTDKPGMFKKYQSEYYTFKAALWQPDDIQENLSLWKVLDELHKD